MAHLNRVESKAKKLLTQSKAQRSSVQIIKDVSSLKLYTQSAAAMQGVSQKRSKASVTEEMVSESTSEHAWCCHVRGGRG
ncbi:hypothetical protein DCS_03076 [Drechmeria coniospora]|uniref:Uncharacterized protein n=1 Tax=Drechmeria coniospora TaxID=98403 RepID=A0A151GXW5_DRECN|nr:hypothetical protein DCS_03076 [Drechmeria coniospora]KYK61931.1 hypothetical protein DCS_03076 [Drechmeria coniospora]